MFHIRKRYTVTSTLAGAIFILMLFVLPNVDSRGLKAVMIVSLLLTFVSYGYTYRQSSSLPQRSTEDLLTKLREGVDPSLMCPVCNILQSRAVHCPTCNLCVADPFSQHSHLLATCITSRNRNSFIVFISSLLWLDLICMLVAIASFTNEIVPGLQ